MVMTGSLVEIIRVNAILSCSISNLLPDRPIRPRRRARSHSFGSAPTKGAVYL